ncbi:AMP-binding protein [Streptomyces sp. NPDC050161]|uniref:AMP-binding protein n=1 Tax=Streptomyces sp. NPDC050161 TaxID=3365604 RepID=UPI00379B093B
MTVAGGFLARAAAHPERTALVLGGAPDQRCGYAQLLGGALAVARALRATLGACPGPGVRVAVLLGSCRELLEIFYGGALAGVPVMVFDPAWSAAELAAIEQDTPPALLFRAGPAAGSCGARSSTVIEVGGPGYEDWLRRAGGRGADGVEGLPEVSGGAPFYVAFTSGSTGRPKGAVRSHRSWLRSFERTTAEFAIDATDRVLLPGSLGHSHFLYGAVHGLHCGAQIHLLPGFGAGAVFDALDRHMITRLYLVPTMFEALLDHAQQNPGRSFPAVRSLLSVGAKWSPARRAQAGVLFPNADAAEFYGATELSLVSLLHGDGDGPRDSVGRPVAGVELSLRSPSGEEVAPGGTGRVYVRSDMLFSGYLSDQDSGAPDGDGWFSVGDVGRVDEDGYLYLVGRDKGMLISGGLNIYPEEVEAALQRLDEIAEAAVIALPDERWGDLVCAVVRWREGAGLSRAEVRDGAAAHLSRQKCPRRVFATDRMPYTSSGKIDRRELRGILLDGRRHGLQEVV